MKVDTLLVKARRQPGEAARSWRIKQQKNATWPWHAPLWDSSVFCKASKNPLPPVIHVLQKSWARTCRFMKQMTQSSWHSSVLASCQKSSEMANIQRMFPTGQMQALTLLASACFILAQYLHSSSYKEIIVWPGPLFISPHFPLQLYSFVTGQLHCLLCFEWRYSNLVNAYVLTFRNVRFWNGVSLALCVHPLPHWTSAGLGGDRGYARAFCYLRWRASCSIHIPLTEAKLSGSKILLQNVCWEYSIFNTLPWWEHNRLLKHTRFFSKMEEWLGGCVFSTTLTHPSICYLKEPLTPDTKRSLKPVEYLLTVTLFTWFMKLIYF